MLASIRSLDSPEHANIRFLDPETSPLEAFLSIYFGSKPVCSLANLSIS